MAEVIIYNRVLTSAERETVNNYLVNKYGIATATAPSPSGLTTVAVSSTQVALQWNDGQLKPGTIYMVERQTGGGSWTQIIEQADVLSFIDQGLNPLTAYNYRVRARSVGGLVSGYSNTSSATTDSMAANMPSAKTRPSRTQRYARFGPIPG